MALCKDTYSVPVEEDPSPPFPFNLIEGMMPIYPLIALMGFMMVAATFFVGLFILAPAENQFFSDTKAVREMAAPGDAEGFVEANVIRHVTETWVPSFKFLGLGFGLLAITMALGTVAKRLRCMGKLVNSHMGRYAPKIPKVPIAVRFMQGSAMMGIMILMGTFVISLVLALSIVPSYFNNSIADTLNPAEVGSDLLNQLAIIQSHNLWLAPLRMVGMTFLFTGILIALGVIIWNLRIQADLMMDYINRVRRVSA